MNINTNECMLLIVVFLAGWYLGGIDKRNKFIKNFRNDKQSCKLDNEKFKRLCQEGTYKMIYDQCFPVKKDKSFCDHFVRTVTFPDGKNKGKNILDTQTQLCIDDNADAHYLCDNWITTQGSIKLGNTCDKETYITSPGAQPEVNVCKFS